MNNKKFKGFTIAELLIALLIISIVLSAAIPTLTKRAGASRENIWRWSTDNNNAYFGTGHNQTAILGYNTSPVDTNSILLSSILTDSVVSLSDYGNGYSTDYTGEINIKDVVNLSFYGDKLAILKKNIDESPHLTNSQISFYTVDNSTSATTSDVDYAGRLSLDQGNIALGMGSLQSMNADNVGENTALGHFSLLRNTSGVRNTAVGKKTLSYNQTGAFNTALGFASLFELGDTGNDTESITPSLSSYTYSENTAIGAMAMEANKAVSFNTAVGARALRHNQSGNYNTAIGHTVFNSLTSGDYNTGIGSMACSIFSGGDGNICLGFNAGTYATQDNYALYIGSKAASCSGSDSDCGASLITGHSMKTDDDDQELIVNARHVKFQAFNASDGYSGNSVFDFQMFSGFNDETEDGYGSAGEGTKGIAHFNLFNIYNNDKSTRLELQAVGKTYITSGTYSGYYYGTDYNNKALLFDTYSPYSSILSSLSNVIFNRQLEFDFVTGTTATDIHQGTVGLNTTVLRNSEDTKPYPLLINERFKIAHELGDTPYVVHNSSGFLVTDDITGTDTTYNLFVDSSTGSINLSTNNWAQQICLNSEDDTFTLKLGVDGSSNVIYADNDSFSLGAASINIGSSDDSTIAFNGKTITFYEDFSIYTGTSSNSVGNVGQTLYRLTQRMDQMGSSGGGMSDARLKNISSNSTAGLNEINALEVKNFTYKDDKEKKPHVGVIAQQLQKIFPNSVYEGDDGYLRINTDEIFYAMVNAIKDLFSQIQDLTAKITGLDKRIDELEKQNKLLTEQNKEFEKRLEKLEKKAKQK